MIHLFWNEKDNWSGSRQRNVIRNRLSACRPCNFTVYLATFNTIDWVAPSGDATLHNKHSAQFVVSSVQRFANSNLCILPKREVLLIDRCSNHRYCCPIKDRKTFPFRECLEFHRDNLIIIDFLIIIIWLLLTFVIILIPQNTYTIS